VGSHRPLSLRAIVPSAGPATLRVSPSRSDVHRELEQRIARAGKLADQIESICDEADSSLAAAVALRHEQLLAWLLLCHRGWPRARRVEAVDVELVTQWLEGWAEFVAIPHPAVRPPDVIRAHLLRRRLRGVESKLRSMLPATVWAVVGPVDRAGRATLASLLEALTGWLEACARSDDATRKKERLAVWLALFTHQAAYLGLRVPSAPLDIDGWRDVAAEARGLAAALAQRVAAA
jgi:hypothetical protein